MKRKNINTILWMIIFAAVTFCIIPIVLAVVVFTHISSHMSDTSLEVVLWLLRIIFLLSPLVALFFGLRGLLPGTRRLDVTKRGADTTSKILAFIVCVIVALFTWGAWVAVQPFPKRPNISITFLGYTNDAAGTRLAKIKVTNLDPAPIFIYAPQIEIQAPANASGYETYLSGVRCSWEATLGRGTPGSFTIPPPTNQSPWRLSFEVFPDRGKGVKNIMKRAVAISCFSVGLWPRFAKYLPDGGAFMIPYNITGHWIKNAK